MICYGKITVPKTAKETNFLKNHLSSGPEQIKTRTGKQQLRALSRVEGNLCSSFKTK